MKQLHRKAISKGLLRFYQTSAGTMRRNQTAELNKKLWRDRELYEKRCKAISKGKREFFKTPAAEAWREKRSKAAKERWKNPKASWRKHNGICDICGRPCKVQKDHCHISGRKRGILCFSCNVGIGYFKDNKLLLRRAINYLQKYRIRFPRLKIRCVNKHTLTDNQLNREFALLGWKSPVE